MSRKSTSLIINMADNQEEEITQNDISQMLIALQKGDRTAVDEIFVKLEPALRRIARQYMNRERQNHTLQPTAIVNEAYLKLINEKSLTACTRAEFFAIVANVMRRILVDHARKQLADKRNGGKRVELHSNLTDPNHQNIDLLALDEALNELYIFDATAYRVVELRFFTGLSNREIADSLHVTERTVIRKWMIARKWLSEKLR